eukprot:363443-Chlamydomonas_euryale.AAC.3
MDRWEHHHWASACCWILGILMSVRGTRQRTTRPGFQAYDVTCPARPAPVEQAATETFSFFVASSAGPASKFQSCVADSGWPGTRAPPVHTYGTSRNFLLKKKCNRNVSGRVCAASAPATTKGARGDGGAQRYARKIPPQKKSCCWWHAPRARTGACHRAVCGRSFEMHTFSLPK